MTTLDVCQCFKLTNFNSHKDLMGLIVISSPGRQWEARREWGGGVIVLAGGDSPWKGWLHNPDM